VYVKSRILENCLLVVSGLVYRVAAQPEF